MGLPAPAEAHFTNRSLRRRGRPGLRIHPRRMAICKGQCLCLPRRHFFGKGQGHSGPTVLQRKLAGALEAAVCSLPELTGWAGAVPAGLRAR